MKGAPMNANLTDRQRAIVDFIRSFRADRGFPPTVREIGEKFGIRSPNGVMHHLHALRKRGAIDWDEASPRSIRLLKGNGAGVVVEPGDLNLSVRVGTSEEWLTAEEAEDLAGRLLEGAAVVRSRRGAP